MSVRNKMVVSARESVWSSQMRAEGGSLFDRIISDEEDMTTRKPGDPVDAKVRSIKRNLARVLNVRSGGSASVPEIGVVDFNDSVMHSTDLARNAAESIRSCIALYEPRLGEVHVEHVSDPDRPLLLQFAIVASLAVANGREQVRIDILMEEGRSCRVV